MKLRGNAQLRAALHRRIEERGDENSIDLPRIHRLRIHLAWLHWRGNVVYAPIGMDTASIPRDLYKRLLRLGNFQDHTGRDYQLDRSDHLPCIQLETLCRMGYPRLCRTLRLLGSNFFNGCRVA